MLSGKRELGTELRDSMLSAVALKPFKKLAQMSKDWRLCTECRALSSTRKPGWGCSACCTGLRVQGLRVSGFSRFRVQGVVYGGRYECFSQCVEACTWEFWLRLLCWTAGLSRSPLFKP